MPDIANYVARFEGDDSSFIAASRRVDDALDSIEAALNDCIASFTNFERVVGRSVVALDTLTASANGTAVAIRELNVALDPAIVTAFGNGITSTSRRMAGFGRTTAATTTNVEAFSVAATTATGQATALATALNNLGRQGGGGGGAGNIGGGLRTFAQTSGRIGASLTRTVTMPILAAGAASVYLGVQFESAMTKIQALAGVSKAQVDSWSNSILKLAPALGKSPKELADALFYIASEGHRGSDALDILTRAAKMSAIGMGETKDNAKALVFVMHDWADAHVTAAQASDVLTKAVQVGNVDTETLTRNLGKIAPVASAMKVPFDQVAAAIATLTKEGASAAQATTGVTAVLRGLLHPAAGVVKAFADVAKSSHDSSFSAAELRREMQDNLLGALFHIETATKGNVTAIGNLFPRSQALSGVLGILSRDLNATKADFDKVTYSADTLDQGMTAVDKTAKQKLNKTLAELEVTGIHLSSILLPFVLELAKRIEKLAEDFDKLSDSQKNTILTIGLLAASIGPALTAFSKMAQLVMLLRSGLGLLDGAVIALQGGLAGLLTTLAALTATPWVIAIPGLAEMAVGAYEINKQLKERDAAWAATDKASNSAAIDFVRTHGFHEAKALLDNQFAPANVIKGGNGTFTTNTGFNTAAHPFSAFDLQQAIEIVGEQNYDKAEHRKLSSLPPVPMTGAIGGHTPNGKWHDYGLHDPASGKNKKVKEPKEDEASKELDRIRDAIRNRIDALAEQVRLGLDPSASDAAEDALNYGDLASQAGKLKGLKLAFAKAGLSTNIGIDPTDKGLLLTGDQLTGLTEYVEKMHDAAEAGKEAQQAHKSWWDTVHQANIDLLKQLNPAYLDQASYDVVGMNYKGAEAAANKARNPHLKAPFTGSSPAQDALLAIQAQASIMAKQAQKEAADAVQSSEPAALGIIPMSAIKDMLDKSREAADKARDALNKWLEAKDKVIETLTKKGRDASTKDSWSGRRGAAIQDAIGSSAGVLGDAPSGMAQFAAAVQIAQAAAHTADLEQQATYQKNYSSGVGDAQKALAALSKQTDAARLAAIEFDNDGLQRMTKDQAQLVLALDKSVEHMTKFREQMTQLAQSTADLLGNTMNQIFNHGFKDLFRNVVQSAREMIQSIIIDLTKAQLSSYISGKLTGTAAQGKPQDVSSWGRAIATGSAAGGYSPASLGISSLMGIASLLSGMKSKHADVNNLALPTANQDQNAPYAPGLLGVLSAFGVKPFSDGGQYGYGQPRLIGKDGPEIDVPRHSGTVIPNGVSVGGGTTNNEIHLHVHMPPGYAGDRKTAQQSGSIAYQQLQAHANRSK